MTVTKWWLIAADTDTSQLNIYVQNSRRSKHRIDNDRDPHWLLTLATEAERVTQYLRVMGATRDIEIVFKTYPVKQNGWEIASDNRAIRIEVFTQAPAVVIDSDDDDGAKVIEPSVRRPMKNLMYVLRHEFGHACHDLFHKTTADSWAAATREHYAEAFAIKFGTNPDVLYEWCDPDTDSGQRYFQQVKAVSLPMDRFITNKLRLGEITSRTEEGIHCAIEVGYAIRELQSFIPMRSAAKSAAKPSTAKK